MNDCARILKASDLMAAGSAAKLYTPDLLSLATELAQYPVAGEWNAFAEVRSQTCGSSLSLGINTDAHGAITEFGLAVTACAVGQAAAAIFARGARSLDRGHSDVALTQLSNWLGSSDAPPPDWSDIDLLSNARAYPGRHGAILLPWKAAQQALCKVHHTR